MNNTIYIILAVVFALYLALTIINRNKSKSRKSKKFMGDYERKDKHKKN
ncbi:hypothetical protein Q2T41_15650 [Maribacter confluentis]|uniref:Uncharacterized protein n=2 Tax=Maribacter TaxID=252356 RepID=A0ABY1SKI6_9FLAO|nr:MULTISPECIES: hypothetical protein [Maribacter]MDO1514095.1 hypothetical protein [Maribacter confluentis]TVZ17266.1 hypothetical protein JM81_3544 [Maribacter sp. MAR_2009_72]SNR70550.1 hypothetical protein SAMN04488009_3299 [Maribacter sedimenticola]